MFILMGVVRLKVAVVGSRQADGQAVRQILRYLPANASEIVSGGAQGVDALAGPGRRPARSADADLSP